MFSKALFALAVVAVAVNAQSSTDPSPTGTPSDSPCIDACINPAAIQNGCSTGSIEDLTCICTNTQFQADARGCLQTNCPAADLQNALQLLQQICIAGGFTPSFSATPTPRPVSFTPVPGSSIGSRSGSSVPSSSPAGTPPSGSSVSKSATGSVVAASSSPSTAAGTSPQAGAGAIFGAIFAAIFAL